MNIQEYVDSEVAKGNTDIRIPDDVEPVNVLRFPPGVSITFPWMSLAYPTTLIKQRKIE